MSCLESTVQYIWFLYKFICRQGIQLQLRPNYIAIRKILNKTSQGIFIPWLLCKTLIPEGKTNRSCRSLQWFWCQSQRALGTCGSLKLHTFIFYAGWREAKASFIRKTLGLNRIPIKRTERSVQIYFMIDKT